MRGSERAASLWANLRSRAWFKESKETFWSFASKGLAALLFYGLNIYLARTLGVEMYGRWSLLLSTLTIVFSLSYLGLNNATRAFTARFNGTLLLQEVLKGSIIARFWISAGFTAAFLLLSQPLAQWLERPELREYALPAALLIFSNGFLEYAKQMVTGLHRIVFHLALTGAELLAKLLFAVVLLDLARGIGSVLHAYWMGTVLATAIGGAIWWGFYRRAGQFPPPEQPAPPEQASRPPTSGSAFEWDRPPRHMAAALLRYSLPLFLISIGFLIQTEIDTQMLGVLSTDHQVGLFAVGKQIANKLPQIAFAMAMGTMPVFARTQLTDDRAALARKFRTLMAFNALIFLPIGAGLMLLSPWLVPWLFGQTYAAAVLPLQILTVWIVLSSFNIFLNQFLDYQGRAARRALNFSLTIAATVALNWLLIPQFGAAGAAFSTTVSYVPYVALNYLEVRQIFASAQSQPDPAP